MSKGSGSTRATNSRTAHGGGGNSGDGRSKIDILKGIPVSQHDAMLKAADKVSKMTISERAAIKPSLSTAMEYAVALKMNPERNELVSIFASKGTLVHGDGIDSSLANGVYDVNGLLFNLAGNEVHIGVKVTEGGYVRKQGRAVLQPTKISKGLSTINVYDTEKMKKLISTFK